MGTSALLALVGLAACGARPQPLLVCHNSHCAGATDSTLDDTLDALDASLALGPTVIDGDEIDFAWSVDHCVFAHAPEPTAPPSTAPVDRLARYLTDTGGQTPSGEPFVLYIELKPTGDPPVDELAACAVDAIREVTAAGPAQAVVSSFSPELIAAFDRQAHAAGITARLAAELLPPTRTDLAAFPADFGVVSVDPLEIDRATIERYRALGLDVALWGDLVTPELFDWILATEPRYVSVGQAQLVRAWIDGP